MRYAAVLCLCLGACATAPPAHERGVGPSIGSVYSSSTSDVPRTFETGVAAHFETIEAGLVVRPDTMSMNVEIEEEAPTAGQALIAAHATASELATRLRQGVAGDATFTPCGTKVMTVGARANAAQPADTFHITVSGRIEVPLAPELDYWKRSALIAALAELADKYAAARAPNAERGVKLNGLRAGVKNAENHRGKLTELWVQRARAFAVAAQAQEAPLFLLDCAPPGDILQKEKSLEEIGLSLSESCRLNSLKAASGGR